MALSSSLATFSAFSARVERPKLQRSNIGLALRNMLGALLDHLESNL
jgi:hypothetical protein